MNPVKELPEGTRLLCTTTYYVDPGIVGAYAGEELILGKPYSQMSTWVRDPQDVDSDFFVIADEDVRTHFTPTQETK